MLLVSFIGIYHNSIYLKEALLAGEWAVGLEELVSKDPTIQSNLSSGGKGDQAKPNLLIWALYSDKTNIGNNLQGYPVHAVCMNGSVTHSKEILRTNKGIVAYIPILPKKSGGSREQATVLKSVHLANCMNVILK